MGVESSYQAGSASSSAPRAQSPRPARRSRHGAVRAGSRCGSFWVRALPRPLAHRGLVRGVLGSADLGSSAAVRRVPLLGAHASEDGRRVVPALRCMFFPPSGAALVAIALATIRQVSAAVTAGVGQKRGGGFGPPTFSARTSGIPGCAVVGSRERRCDRHRACRGLGKRVRTSLRRRGRCGAARCLSSQQASQPSSV